jgi:hypothetical protein
MVDMDSVASVIDTSAMVRMNASWQPKLSCSITANTKTPAPQKACAASYSRRFEQP